MGWRRAPYRCPTRVEEGEALAPPRGDSGVVGYAERIFAHFAGPILGILVCTSAACSDGGGGAQGGGGGSAGEGGFGGASSGEGGSGGGMPCDGTPEQWCGYDAYCNAPAGSCPGGGAVATCALRPNDCAGEPTQIACACDGEIYVNACEAYAAGFDVGSQGGCQAPPNAFACGPVLCAHGTEYCETINEYHRCQPLPEGCKPADAMCDCLNDVLCFAAPGPPFCEKNAEDHFFVTCQITE